MSSLRRRLVQSVTFTGVGVHSGRPALAEVRPAPVRAGLFFTGGGADARIPARLPWVVAASGSTTLGAGDLRVDVPEHLLAALYALGLFDASVRVRGGEIPILDGSAAEFFHALRSAAVSAGPGPRWRAVGSVLVRRGRSWARLKPARELQLRVEVDFGPRGLRSLWSGTLEHFATELAPARTFGFRSDASKLRRRGRALGATAANTTIYERDGSTRQEVSVDAPARHKALDLVGDLALLGAPLAASVEVHRPTHALTHALLRRALLTGALRVDS